MKYNIINIGCRVNSSESDLIDSYLCNLGEKTKIGDADYIFINTCTVTAIAEKKTRKIVRSALNNNKLAKIIVTGCSVNINADYYKNLDSRVIAIDKFKLLEHFKNMEFNPKNQSNSRVNVKIQDGCDNNCTFCIVHIARGKSFSFPPEQIINQCKKLSESGVKEIVLTGINLGNYNLPSLSNLLQLLLKNTTDCRYRISSIEPNNVNKELIETILQSNNRICSHFHLPLQSGSTKVLKEMNRRYSASEYLSLVNQIYELIPNFAITTDVIVGFPGETESDFDDTISVCRKCKFSKIHVFPYSKRQGTPAAQRTDQISDFIKKKRASDLRKLSNELAIKNFESRIGTCEWVVTEEDQIATTDSFFKIKSNQFTNSGDLLKVELKPDMYFKE